MVMTPSLAKAASRTARGAALAVGAGVASAGVLFGYGLGQTTKFILREETLALLPEGSTPIRILHLSDIHMAPQQELKRRWLHSLADLQPDLVVNTGDNLGHQNGLDALITALGPLMAFPGAFVPGSNCYFAPRPKNPLRYLAKSSHVPRNSPKHQLPWRQMHSAFGAAGWVNLTNKNHSMVVNGTRLEFTGVDDPHLGLERFAGWPSGSVSSSAAPHLRIALSHAPYQRVLDTFTDAGTDLILAGHTHGGQVCIPGYGAVVTNCDLPTWRASGLTYWEHAGKSTPLNVSAGIGTSRFAPVRIACPPEAILLTLTDGS
ncbi:metallophosphoesterase [Paeniglutamicibacter gangotriensis]|uniref:Metallophosphoesterase n=1 Tax=Paeniglutamicibacter gangotriensis TaxID=254787 RepID=A0A5B0E4Q9_9MICC|nr:metallophosphoesterase [Paeniglutamicibacter gangotriensis]KAA0973626.1 metallophosphoesterase [Paeniglutamicibacter gangotriensis]